MTIKITPNVLKALNAIEASFEGLTEIDIQTAQNCLPKGRRQDCDDPACGKNEWVDQTQTASDSYIGTVTFIVDDVMIVCGYSL